MERIGQSSVRSVIEHLLGDGYARNPPAAADLNSAPAPGVSARSGFGLTVSRWALTSTTEDRVCVSPFADVASYRPGFSPSSAVR